MSQHTTSPKRWLMEEHLPSGSICWECFEHENHARQVAAEKKNPTTITPLFTEQPIAPVEQYPDDGQIIEAMNRFSVEGNRYLRGVNDAPPGPHNVFRAFVRHFYELGATAGAAQQREKDAQLLKGMRHNVQARGHRSSYSDGWNTALSNASTAIRAQEAK